MQKLRGFSGNLLCDLDGRLCDLRKERPPREGAEGVSQTAQIYGVKGKRGIFHQHECAASDGKQRQRARHQLCSKSLHRRSRSLLAELLLSQVI